MCGIAAYVGKQHASTILFNALRRMEYRGYDSVGIAIVHNGKLDVKKDAGKLESANKKLRFAEMPGNRGICHTRWSTHGKPTLENAHPHNDCKNELAIVHNGILENYLQLKEELKDHHFLSETDSEVFAHLIEEQYHGDLLTAVQKALVKAEGTYALCVLHVNHPEIIVARNGSPMAVGLGDREMFAGSDVSAFIEYTKRVVYLDDLDIAVLNSERIRLYDKAGKEKLPNIETVNWDVLKAQKHGYKHFMLKEIFEQPLVVKQSLGITITLEQPQQISIVACGTAFFAALIGKYLIEQ